MEIYTNQPTSIHSLDWSGKMKRRKRGMYLTCNASRAFACHLYSFPGGVKLCCTSFTCECGICRGNAESNNENKKREGKD